MPSKRKSSAKRGASVWLDAGLTALAEDGATALTLERMCSAVGKTRGSFYHHFTDHDAFIAAMVERWIDLQTEDMIDQADTETDPNQRAKRLNSVVGDLDHALDIAMRRFACENAVAQQAVTRVDERRLSYLTDLLRDTGAPDPELQAKLEYALLVGWQTLWPKGEKPDQHDVDAFLSSAALGFPAQT